MSTQLVSARAQSVGTTAVIVGNYTAAAQTTGTAITGLSVANTVSTTIFVTIAILNGSNVTNIVKNTAILPGGALSVADSGNRIVLIANDQVIVTSNTPASCDVVMSISQIT